MPEFIKVKSERSGEHEYVLYQHSAADPATLMELVGDCLRAWRLNRAPYTAPQDTGFDLTRVQAILNAVGAAHLPSTPPEDEDVTRCVPVTDLTEVLSIRLLKGEHPKVILPYPRVMHKPVVSAQHQGIDLLGYIEAGDRFVLVVAEVMASVEARNPPTTVRDHFWQLMDQTLDASFPSERLRQELDYLHDEAEDKHKGVLQGFLLALLDGSLGRGERVLAMPILVRRAKELNERDYRPFKEGEARADGARIPARIWFGGIELDRRFCDLLDLVKASATGASSAGGN